MPDTTPENLREELGEIQELAASISRRAACKEVSQVFAKLCDIIGDYYQKTRSVKVAARKCKSYLKRRVTPDHIEKQDDLIQTDIRAVQERISKLTSDTA